MTDLPHLGDLVQGNGLTGRVIHVSQSHVRIALANGGARTLRVRDITANLGSLPRVVEELDSWSLK